MQGSLETPLASSLSESKGEIDVQHNYSTAGRRRSNKRTPADLCGASFDHCLSAFTQTPCFTVFSSTWSWLKLCRNLGLPMQA